MLQCTGMKVMSAAREAWRTANRKLHEPVDAAPLVYFRVFFGTLMVVHVARYFAHGWIRDLYIMPRMHFPYPGFDWVQPLPGAAMYWVFALMGLFAAGMALGAWYRLSAVGFFLLYAYVFLLDITRYVNHYYLMGIAALFLALAPAAEEFSIDARRSRRQPPTGTVPAWTSIAPAIQLSIVYFYAGVAKLNGDWLRGQPLRIWFSERGHTPILGGLLGTSHAPLLFSYGGAFFDICIVPLLLYKKTRKAALIAAVSFHALNSLIFPEIGLFPWFMLAATAAFFPLRDLVPLPAFWRKKGLTSPGPAIVRYRRQTFVTAATCAFLLVQIAMPLKRFRYPEGVMWHEYGSRFSWLMKLWDKKVYDAHFFATGKRGEVLGEIPMLDFLTPAQAVKVAAQPELVAAFARHVRAAIKEKTGKDVGIHADIILSLNGRSYQRLVDPSVNLAAVPDGPGDWIVPLKESP